MLRILYLFLILSLIILYYDAPSFPNNSITISLLSLLFLSILFFFFRSEKYVFLRYNYFRHSVIIILGFLIVHFQVIVDFLLSNIDEKFYYVWVDKSVVHKSMILSIIGILSFLLGYLSYNKTLNSNRNNTTILRTNYLEVISLILLCLYFYFINPLYLLGNYGIIDMGKEANYIAALFEASILAKIIQTSYNLRSVIITKEFNSFSIMRYVKTFGWFSWFIIIIYLLSVLVSGDRGPLIFFSICIIGSFSFINNKKVSIYFLISLILFGSILITALGAFRSLDKDLTVSERINQVFENQNNERFGYNSFSQSTQELSTSFRCLNYSVNNVPKNEYFMLGQFQIQQVLSIVPFSSNLFPIFFERTGFKYSGSPNYITWLEQGNYIYSGTGTTIVADFYLDFGVFGVIVGLFLVGYLMRYAEIVLYSPTIPTLFAYSFSLIYLSNSVYLSRSTFLIVLKLVSWTYFFLYFNKVIFNKSKS